MQGGEPLNIFPMIQPEAVAVNTDLPLYKELDWDFKNNKIIYKDGSPSVVTGKRAVLIWALKALQTKRTRHEIYSWDYGNEIEELIGQAYTQDLKKAEVIRYVKECLLINPYITDITDIQVDFSDGVIAIQCKIATIYGEGVVNV